MEHRIHMRLGKWHDAPTPYKVHVRLERKSGTKQMREIGYARVSTSSQSLDRQIGALRAERCHEAYREKASGKATNPQEEKAIDALGTGDVLVVAEWIALLGR